VSTVAELEIVETSQSKAVSLSATQGAVLEFVEICCLARTSEVGKYVIVRIQEGPIR
jgi:hypothetical protein